MPMSDASVSVIDGRAVVRVGGSELLAPIVKQVTDAAASAADDRDAAEIAAATSIAATRYFTTRAAGEAASTVNQAFATDDGAGNVIYYKRTAGGSTEIGRAVTPASLSSAGGAERVGFQLSDTTRVWSLAARARSEVFITDFYNAADGTDLAICANRAILQLCGDNGGKLKLPYSRSPLSFRTTVLLGPRIDFDMSGQEVEGLGPNTGTMFASATLKGGVMERNAGKEAGIEILRFTKVHSGMIRNAGMVFDFNNFEYGCSINDIHTEDCRQVARWQRCFYMSVDNLNARGSSDPAFPTYHLAGENNAISLKRLSGVTEFVLLIEGGTTGLSLDVFTAEGGATGIKCRDDITCISMRNSYFENLPGTALDLRETGVFMGDLSYNYFQKVGTVFDDGGSTGTNRPMFGRFANWLGPRDDIWAMDVKADGAFNFMKFELPDATDGAASLPSNYRTSRASRVETTAAARGANAADIQARTHLYGNGVIPKMRVGDVGAPAEGEVPFCTVSYPTGPSVTAKIVSRIKWQPAMLITRYYLTVNEDEIGTSFLFGDTAGDRVYPKDATGKAVTITQEGGFVVLNIAGLKNSAGIRKISGTFEIA